MGVITAGDSDMATPEGKATGRMTRSAKYKIARGYFLKESINRKIIVS